MMIESPTIVFLNTYGVFLFAVATFLYFYIFEKNKKLARVVIYSSIATYFLTILFKNLFEVARPYTVNGHDALAGALTQGSFPSFHTALAFAVATTAAFSRKKTAVVMFLIAAIIGFGRVAANVHYPLDVAFGAILGALVTLTIQKLA